MPTPYYNQSVHLQMLINIDIDIVTELVAVSIYSNFGIESFLRLI